MDGPHFESLVRSMLPSGTRRAALAAILGGGLGAPGLVKTAAKKKKRKKKRRCGCPGGRVRLANDTCARVCGTAADDCAAGCDVCSDSVEGERHCRPPLGADCDAFPQTCTGTVQCPVGYHCQPTTCGGGSDRCLPLCA